MPKQSKPGPRRVEVDTSIPEVHPSPFIEHRIDQIQQKAILLHLAMKGLIHDEDGGCLENDVLVAALDAIVFTMFDEMQVHCIEIKGCTERLRETGVAPVTERLRTAVLTGAPPFDKATAVQR